MDMEERFLFAQTYSASIEKNLKSIEDTVDSMLEKKQIEIIAKIRKLNKELYEKFDF